MRGNTSAGYSNFSVPQEFETDEDGRLLVNETERERKKGGVREREHVCRLHSYCYEIHALVKKKWKYC